MEQHPLVRWLLLFAASSLVFSKNGADGLGETVSRQGPHATPPRSHTAVLAAQFGLGAQLKTELLCVLAKREELYDECLSPC
jgi:hypothetical protein